MNVHERDRLAAALSGRYTVEQEVGEGGMATVYRARDLKHDRLVAIKVLKPALGEALGSDRFLREIKLTAQLSHPHILPLLDSGEVGGRLYYVMPYVAGESLRQRLQRDRQLPVDEAVRIAREVADGLDSAHRHGVVHRDIKPENILLEEGHAVIADFGIARAVAESAGDRLTATGIAVGTPAYMSPEQMAGQGAVDARSDIYALACVLYELLAGEPPFNGPTVQAMYARRLSGPPTRVSQLRPAVPKAVVRVVQRALSQAPEQRFASAAEFAAALRPAAAPSSDLGALARLARTPRYAVPVAVLFGAIVLALVLPQRARGARDRARALLSRAVQLADSSRYAEAYELLARAEPDLPGDSAVAGLIPLVSDRLTVTSEPAGARVYVRRFTAEVPRQPLDSVLIGETPIAERRLARGDYRVTVVKPGFVPLEALASSHAERVQRALSRVVSPIVLTARLIRADAAPRGMVFVPGGTYRLMGPDMPAGLEARLDDYFIDRYEVSNEQYKAFVTAGGYRRPEYWRVALGAPPARRFTDRTGMPGPRAWAGADYPPERAPYPVTNVSWYEAAAYCAFVGKALPTAFQWEKAARNGITARSEGVMMPWGYVGPGDGTNLRANFGGAGPAPVDAYPFGISPFGAYNMAGNVKEWTANPQRDGYGVAGGSWEDPIYLYTAYGAVSPAASSPTLGFRCARVQGAATGDQGAFRIRTEQRTPRYTPVGPAEFRALLAHYRYDQRPTEAQIIETVATPDWVRQKVRYVALEGDTGLAYLYLPSRSARPLQTIVYLASSGAFYQIRTVPQEVEWAIGPNVRAGRAVLAVVFKGMAERGFGPGWEPPAPSSVRFRDLMVLHATEMRRAVDYLATRDDIDMRRLSYVAVSWGAGSRLALAAVDDRFRAVVLIGGGIDERLQPTLPEAANFNFAPYIRVPKLLLNGRDDEEHPWYTRGLPLWNLLREPKTLVLVPGGGHVPPLEARVPAINQFLDRILGPVDRTP